MRLRKQSDDFKTRFLVGVAGGSASGKTSICNTIASMMTLERGLKTVTVPLDCFYRPLQEGADPSIHNFDHPDALDMDLAIQVLRKLMNGEEARIPIYNFKTHKREGEIKLPDADLILFEGIFALYDPAIRQFMRMRIFVTCDNDIRFCRRVHRDIRERGRTYNGVVKQYLRFVRPSYHDFIEPTMQHANLIIPSTTNNYECVEFIVQNLLAITRSYTDINSKQYFFGNTLLYSEGRKKLKAEDYLINYSTLGKILFVTEEKIKLSLINALQNLKLFDDHRQQYVFKFIKNELVFYGVVMLKRFLATIGKGDLEFVEYGRLIDQKVKSDKQIVTLAPVKVNVKMPEDKRNQLEGVIVVSLLSRYSSLQFLHKYLGAKTVISIMLTRSSNLTQFQAVINNHKVINRLFQEEYKTSLEQ